MTPKRDDADDPTLLCSSPPPSASAALGGWADHCRGKRRNLDNPGSLPWQFILVLSIQASVVCGSLGVLV